MQKHQAAGAAVLKRLPITFLIVAVIALLAVYYSLGADYLRQSQGNEALADQVTGATQALAQTPLPPADLAQRLAAAEASLAAAQGALPGDLNSTRVVNAILELADDCQVKAIPLSTKPWTTEKTGGGYDVFRLSMVIRGSFPRLSSFVSQLESGELDTIVIENMEVARVAASPGETDPVAASLNLAVYVPLTAAE